MINATRRWVHLLLGLSTIGASAGAQAFTLPVLDAVTAPAGCSWTAADASLARRGIARTARVQTGGPQGLSRLVMVYLDSTRGLRRFSAMTTRVVGYLMNEEGASADFGPSGSVSRGSREFITRDVKEGTGESRTIHLVASDSVKIRSLAEAVMKLCGA